MLPVINARRGRIPARFSRNLQSSYLVSGALTVNIWMDLLKGYGVMGVLIRVYLVSPKFSVTPSGKTRCRTHESFWSCGNVLNVLYHTFTDAKFGGYRNSPAAGAAKNVEYFVCLSVRHAFERLTFCARFRHEGVGV